MDRKNFMIIDDDSDDRFFFKEVITEIFISSICLEAKSGTDALQQLRNAEHLPDYIFLDINMPRMNGSDCLKQLKEDANLKGIPVIMYSTSFTEESIKEFDKLGASSYLNKPTDMNSLPALIIEAIRGL